ncbi:hypothetical protein BN988_02796 [Oceanobacillus picturae]|uniref:Uncharacterized protein n=1 Tax=Oceanobacillus picturae TaxID=171693 RepID=W9AEU8_9BACI|nr:hypothetical protein [Oceanobacillus picturae]CDO04244.1 hypothetical protein BN988_02796 [Oceanobacillus picturae]
MFLTIFYHIVLPLLDFSQYNYKITTMSWIHLNSASDTTAPKSETTAPQSETTTPKSETTAPKSETIVPQSETTTPKSETTAPESETTTPQSETIAPPDAPHQINSQNGHTNLTVTLQC